MYSEVMRPRPLLLWLVGLAVLAVGPLGCGADGPTCGAGTREKDGKCVAVAVPTTCGAGTVLQGEACVADPALADVVQDTAAGDSAGDAPDGADGADPDVDADGAVDDQTGDAGDVSVPCDPPCDATEVCLPSGLCAPAPPPAAWSCPAASFADGSACHCACGAPDPDCKLPGAKVMGCTSGQCNADGTCGACKPDCTGKVCGLDGCGGTCGVCGDPAKPLCKDGACAAWCTPSCSAKQCGDDGCAGSCGSCAKGLVCSYGQCAKPDQAASCVGNCGGTAASGCSCVGGCESLGTCCADAVAACGCLPNCAGKTCGGDGCGGVCGACDQGQQCDAGQCGDDPCDPDPCAGHGACNAKSGSCTCLPAYAGPNCAVCAQGYAGYPDCK